MLKSQEIMNEINSMKENANKLYAENKLAEANEILDSIENKKAEYETAIKVENLSKENLEVKDDVKMEKKEELINGLSKEKADFLNAVRTNQFSNKFSTGDQGAIIPQTVSQDIIEAVKERLDIVALSTKFNVKGELKFPVYGTDSSDTGITASYSEDFSELTETSGKFTSVSLKEHLIGCLAIVGKSLIANTDIAVYNFVVGKVADAIVDFLQAEMTKGNATKIKGYETTNNTVEMEGSKISTNDLISMMAKVKTPFQANAKFIMNTEDLTAIRKLKDSNGQYVLNPDVRGGFGMTILGKPVVVNDEAESIVYGDLSGYYTNIVEAMEIQVLTEKYATQHAIGICAYVQADGKPVDTQKYVKLVAKVGA